MKKKINVSVPLMRLRIQQIDVNIVLDADESFQLLICK